MKASLKVSKKLLSRFDRKVNTLKGRSVEVGHFKGEEHPVAKVDYSTLAKWLEYGTSNGIQAYRPLTRLVFMYPLKDEIQFQKKVLKYLVRSRGTVDSMLNELGSLYVEKLKDLYGDSVRLPAGLPSTIASKGGANTPLVDKGFLKNAITHKVKRKRKLK